MEIAAHNALKSASGFATKNGTGPAGSERAVQVAETRLWGWRGLLLNQPKSAVRSRYAPLPGAVQAGTRGN